jgi:hypothetical protein
MQAMFQALAALRQLICAGYGKRRKLATLAGFAELPDESR